MHFLCPTIMTSWDICKFHEIYANFIGYMQDEFEVNAVDGPWGDFSFSGE